MISRVAVGDVVRRVNDGRVGVVNAITQTPGQRSLVMVEYGPDLVQATAPVNMQFVASGPIKWTKGKAWMFMLLVLASAAMSLWIVSNMYTSGYHDVLVLSVIWLSMQITATAAHVRAMRPSKTVVS